LSGPDSIEDLSMLDLFRMEVENHGRVLESGLVAAEGNPSPAAIEPLMRAAHSLKGASRIVGLNRGVTLAHAMEDVLSAAQHGRRTLCSKDIDLLLRSTDIFLRLAGLDTAAIPACLEENAEAISALSQALSAILSGKPVEAPAPAAVAPPEPAGRTDGTPKESLPEKADGSFVRVQAENLNRLMGLAGECLVQARSVKQFSASLLKIKNWQQELDGALEQLQNSGAMAGEHLSEPQKHLEQIRDLLAVHSERFELFSRRLEHSAGKLYDEVIASRMRPFSDGLLGFPRMVRDLAQELGKKISFRIEGEATRVDRDILEQIESPLIHLLRNAIDHGIESPDERTTAGKPAEGTIVLEARHRSGMLNIRIHDDGRGIDPEQLRRKIVARGYVAEDTAARLSNAELYDFLFLPGFSTAGAVTELSGRGVGLDVVFSKCQRVGGSVRVESQPGLETSFHLQLPLTLSVLRTLLVSISGESYALPLTRIDRILTVSPDELHSLDDRQFITVNGEHIGIVTAQQAMNLPPQQQDSAPSCIAVISDRLNLYGLAVDRFLSQRDLVVIPLDPRLGKIPTVSAGAIAEEGSPVLILDVDDLVRSINSLVTQGSLHKVGGAAELPRTARKRILVVDDSLTVREVERKLLENSGYEVVAAVDGVDGWNSLQRGTFDLVVSDIDMPRMNGIELVRRIKNDPALKNLPVMIVSYKDREEDRLLGLEAGANYYLTKSSFHDQTLITAVKDLIGAP